MDGRPSLGGAVRAHRRRLGRTQGQPAARRGPGVRRAHVARPEPGAVGLPRRRRLEGIAAALGVPPGELPTDRAGRA